MSRFAPAIAVLLCSLLVVTPARAADRHGEARAHYDSAKREFEEGKYDEAAKDFTAAYDIVGEVAILYNVAQAYRAARRYEKAGEAYRNFLSRVGKDAPNRAEIEGRILEMDERAADERRRADRARQDAASPHHHIEITSSNTSNDANNSSGTAEVPQGQPGWVLEVIGYSLIGLAGASLVTGIAMSLESTSESHAVQRAAAMSPHVAFSSALQEDQRRGQIYDKVGIAMYVLAGASAIGAGVTIGLGKSQDKQWQAEHALRIIPGVGPGGGGIILAGHF